MPVESMNGEPGEVEDEAAHAPRNFRRQDIPELPAGVKIAFPGHGDQGVGRAGRHGDL